MRARTAFPAVVVAAALAAAAPGGVWAQSGVVVGSVFDSIGSTPLENAAVFLWETTYQAVSDENGRFRIEDVPPGRYDILFFHTQLGEMGISPGPLPIIVEEGEQSRIALATPSMLTIIASECLLEGRPPGTGIVAGWVEDTASDLRLGGSSVTLSWKDPGEPMQYQYMRSGPGGWFHTCSAPADTPLLGEATFFGRASPRREIVVAEGDLEEVSFALSRQKDSHVTGRVFDAATGGEVEGAEVWLRGTDERTLTDDRGLFDLGEIQPGTYMLVTDHIVYGERMDTLRVPDGLTMNVDLQLDSRPIELTPITVTVEAPEPISANMGGGIMITSQDIAEVRQRSRDASDVLRSLHVPGVIVSHLGTGRVCVGYTTGQVKMNQNGCVEMMVFINDVRATNSEQALRIPPDAIERMVIYKPIEASNLFGLGGASGVWMIYTKGN